MNRPKQSGHLIKASINQSKRQVEFLAKSGKLPEARKLAINLCSNNSKDPESWFLLGVIYNLQGDIQKTIECSKKTVELAPQTAIAHFNLGVALRNASQFHEAIAPLKQSILLSPEMFAAHRELGIVYTQLGEVEMAIQHLIESSRIHPAGGEAWFALGSLYESQNDLKQAENCYRNAIKYNPVYIEAGINLGNVLKSNGGTVEAESWYKTFLQQLPDEPDILHNLAVLYQETLKFSEAEKIYRKLLKLQPERKGILRNLGKVLLAQFRPEDAVVIFEKLIDEAPENLDNRRHLARAICETGDISKAIECLKKNIALDINHIPSHQDHACLLLQSGDFKNGWPEYEWRTRAKDLNTQRWPFPDWSGTSTKTLLIYPEQGIGDEIMFSSCIPDLSMHVKNIILTCEPRLYDLFQRSFPNIRIISRAKNEGAEWLKQLPKIDAQISIASLPKFLRLDVSNFPAHSGYLVAPENEVKKWRDRYQKLGSGLNIGISWRGGNNFDTRFKRSLEVESLAKNIQIPGINVINLQYGECTKELALIKNKTGLTISDWPDSDPLNDMDDFFAKIKALDLVISIDNSTVHVAGALGVKTWIMQPYIPDWRWQLNTDYSYWYPSVLQYRQPSPGNWHYVLEQIKNDLDTLNKSTK